MRNFIAILLSAATVLVGCGSPSSVQTQTSSPTAAAPAPFPPGFAGQFPRVPTRDEQLQAAFDQFPLATLRTNSEGRPQFQTLPDMDPVAIDGDNYYGFRFKVPQRTNAEDFVWAMIRPPNLTGWYIVPEKGAMPGFQYYRSMPITNYLNMSGLRPLNQEALILQSLAGTNFTDGQTCLLWWTRTGDSRPESVVFNFATLGPTNLNKVQPMEEALGLVRASNAPSSDLDEKSPLLPDQDAHGPTRDEQLQSAFLQFPPLTLSNDSRGLPAFQTLPPMPPVVINGGDFYGFRFTVPQRTNSEDFVWAMIQPPNLAEWYIVPEKGEMSGFENFRNTSRYSYLNTSALRPNPENLILQSLAGASLTNGQTYLIWWRRTGTPRPESVAFTFATLDPKNRNRLHPMEKALGLVPAPPPPPFRPVLITTLGTDTPPDGTWRIEVSEHALDLSHAAANNGHAWTTTSLGTAGQWTAHPGWFVFIETTSRVWAYDGDRSLLLLAYTSSGANSSSTIYDRHFPCPVPPEVLSRLTDPARNALKPDQ
jgi:hypothetical protein